MPVCGVCRRLGSEHHLSEQLHVLPVTLQQKHHFVHAVAVTRQAAVRSDLEDLVWDCLFHQSQRLPETGELLIHLSPPAFAVALILSKSCWPVSGGFGAGAVTHTGWVMSPSRLSRPAMSGPLTYRYPWSPKPRPHEFGILYVSVGTSYPEISISCPPASPESGLTT